jgi:hypothetical protein
MQRKSLCNGIFYSSSEVVSDPNLYEKRPKSEQTQRSLPQLPLFVSPYKKEKDKGKLVCCLKVEIKAGVYKMLPIHQVHDIN